MSLKFRFKLTDEETTLLKRVHLWDRQEGPKVKLSKERDKKVAIGLLEKVAFEIANEEAGIVGRRMERNDEGVPFTVCEHCDKRVSSGELEHRCTCYTSTG